MIDYQKPCLIDTKCLLVIETVLSSRTFCQSINQGLSGMLLIPVCPGATTTLDRSSRLSGGAVPPISIYSLPCCNCKRSHFWAHNALLEAKMYVEYGTTSNPQPFFLLVALQSYSSYPYKSQPNRVCTITNIRSHSECGAARRRRHYESFPHPSPALSDIYKLRILCSFVYVTLSSLVKYKCIKPEHVDNCN